MMRIQTKKSELWGKTFLISRRGCEKAEWWGLDEKHQEAKGQCGEGVKKKVQAEWDERWLGKIIPFGLMQGGLYIS